MRMYVCCGLFGGDSPDKGIIIMEELEFLVYYSYVLFSEDTYHSFTFYPVLCFHRVFSLVTRCSTNALEFSRVRVCTQISWITKFYREERLLT